MNDDSTKLHRTTYRVLTLLSLLSQHEDGLTFTEVQQLVDIPKGTLSPILHTMEHMRFISLSPTTGRYSIGVNTYLAGKVYGRSDALLQFITEEMHQIVSACSETCQLGILEGANVAYVAKVDSPSPIRLISDVGKVFPVYCTAIGKAILSECSREEVEELLPRRFPPIPRIRSKMSMNSGISSRKCAAQVLLEILKKLPMGSPASQCPFTSTETSLTA